MNPGIEDKTGRTGVVKNPIGARIVWANALPVERKDDGNRTNTVHGLPVPD